MLKHIWHWLAFLITAATALAACVSVVFIIVCTPIGALVASFVAVVFIIHRAISTIADNGFPWESH